MEPEMSLIKDFRSKTSSDTLSPLTITEFVLLYSISVWL